MIFVRNLFHAPSRFQAYSLLVLATGLHLSVLTRIHNDWWFEDDPNLVVYVEDHPRPLDYFLDRGTILRLTPSRTLTPMQALSFWFDRRLASRDAGFAYLHSGLALILATLLFFETLSRFLPSAHALGAAALWPFLPSTVAVVEFLAARHYLEGFVWLNLSLIAALGSGAANKDRRSLWVLLAVPAWILSALNKELFVTTGFILLAWLFVRSSQHFALAGATAAFLGYFCYRFWAIGLIGEGFDSGWGFLFRYWELLWRLPVIVAGNALGYAVFLGLIGLALALTWRGAISGRHWLFWTAQFAVLAATVLPVTQQLSEAYRSQGPWLRVAFLLNTFLLAGAFWVFSRCPKPWITWVLGSILAVAVLLGGGGAARRWDALKNPYKLDGQFYVGHPDRLLFTNLPAFFMDGIHNLFSRNLPTHYIAARHLSPNIPRDLNRFSEVWTFSSGGFGVDRRLPSIIARNFDKGIVPLDLESGGASYDFSSSGEKGAVDIAYRDGQLVLAYDSHAATAYGAPISQGKARHFQLLFPSLADRIAPRPGLFLASPGNAGASISLACFDEEGNRLSESAETLESGSFLFAEIADLWPKLTLQNVARISVNADQPLKGAALFRNAFGEPQVLAPSPALKEGPKFLAHVPKPPWQLLLLLGNAGTEAAEVVLRRYPDGEGEPMTDTIRLAGGSLVRWPLLECTAASFETEANTVTAIAIMGNTVDDRWCGYLPASAPSMRLANPGTGGAVSGRLPVWSGVAFFNPNRRSATVRAVAADGVVRGLWDVPGLGKITATSMTEEPAILEYRADLPLVGIGLQTQFWGGLKVWELVPEGENQDEPR